MSIRRNLLLGTIAAGLGYRFFGKKSKKKDTESVIDNR
jgi:hypothetical protein